MIKVLLGCMIKVLQLAVIEMKQFDSPIVFLINLANIAKGNE
jgi:hypothetical protein